MLPPPSAEPRTNHHEGLTPVTALRILAVAIVSLFVSAGAGVHAAPIDLSPEQPGRLHTVRNEQAIALLPKGFPFVQAGTLTVGIHPGSPPISTYATDAKTIVGFDADLVQLIGESLGLKPTLVATAWANWPLGLQSGQFDAVVSNVTVTEERKEKFDFSTYRKDVVGFYVPTNSRITSIREPKDIAGLRVITDSGTNQEKILLEWDRENVAKGLKPIQVQYYTDDAVESLTLEAGRADVIFSVNSSRAYKAALDGKTRLVGTVSGGWPLTAEIAVTTRKGSGLAAPVTAALNGLIANGAYAKLLAHWNLSAEAIDRSLTNPPGLPRS
jgi:polar amino acid transport system substrate-binding protein